MIARNQLTARLVLERAINQHKVNSVAKFNDVFDWWGEMKSSSKVSSANADEDCRGVRLGFVVLQDGPGDKKG